MYDKSMRLRNSITAIDYLQKLDNLIILKYRPALMGVYVHGHETLQGMGNNFPTQLQHTKNKSVLNLSPVLAHCTLYLYRIYIRVCNFSTFCALLFIQGSISTCAI